MNMPRSCIFSFVSFISLFIVFIQNMPKMNHFDVCSPFGFICNSCTRQLIRIYCFFKNVLHIRFIKGLNILGMLDL